MNYCTDRIATVKKTTEIIHNFSISAKKNFGQNFMIAPQVPDIISQNNSITKNTLIIEIGPGVGALTQFLLERAKKVICYEIDEDLIPVLAETLSAYPNLEVINKDFLKVDLAEIDLKEYSNLVVVSNLPYYITSELLIKLLTDGRKYTIIAMMQKEVAQRILKGVGSDENELTVYAKYFSVVSKVVEVSKNDFFPRPNVNSTVLCFEKKDVNDGEDFIRGIKVLFAQRRKTIANNLKDYLSEEEKQNVFKQCNLSSLARIDELNWAELINLVGCLKDKLKG